MLKELEEFEEFEEQDDVYYDLFEEVPEEHRVFLEEKVIYIPRYEIKIRSGVFESWNSERGEYEPDFSCYMIFDALSDELIWTERESFLLGSISNCLSMVKEQIITHTELENLECEVLTVQ